MDRDQWQRVRVLFEQATELPPEERAAFLQRAALTPTEASAVLELLRGDNEGPNFASPLTPRPEQLREGARIGPWVIRRLLGRGGMGAVYLAERDDGRFEQRVAVKRLAAGVDGSRLEAALREQRLLGRLDHPDIARIIDAGIAEDGAPFIVMEYVEGRSLSEWREQVRPTLDQRLALFARICRAVEHAHRNLVLHRDIKPDNILVTDDGHPKLLDFGIGRLLEDGGVAAPGTATVRGLMVMTPEYASPEQLRGEALTTAADVYALGVTLYELLAGVRPFQIGQRAPHAILEAVTGQPAPAPSKRVSGDDRITPRMLRGDLDLIVAQAMHPDLARRYPSPAALADDLDAQRCGMPVSARADSLAYRAGKFVRRQPALVAVTLLALLLTATGLGLAWRSQQAQLAEARRLEAISRFMLGLFDSVTPDQRQGEDFTVASLLDIGARRAVAELDDDAASLHEVLHRIADAQQALRLIEGARRTLALIEADLDRRGADPVLALDAQQLRGDIAALAEAPGEALSIYLEIEGRAKAAGLDTAERRLELAVDIGQVLQELNRLDEAEAHLRQALQLVSEVPGARATRVYQQLAAVAYQRGDFDAGLALGDQALAELAAVEGDRPSLARASLLRSTANQLARIGRFAEGMQRAREGTSIVARLQGEGHPDHGRHLLEQSVAESAAGEVHASLASARRAVEVLGRAEPASEAHRQALGIVAAHLLAAGQGAEAYQATTALLARYELDLGERDFGAVVTRFQQGRAALLLGDADTGLAVLERTLELMRAPPSGVADAFARKFDHRVQAERVRALVMLGRDQAALRAAKALREAMGQAGVHDALELESHFVLGMWEALALERVGRSAEAAAARERAATARKHGAPAVMEALAKDLARYQRRESAAMAPPAES